MYLYVCVWVCIESIPKDFLLAKLLITQKTKVITKLHRKLLTA